MVPAEERPFPCFQRAALVVNDPDPINRPPRTESGSYDHDGHTVVINNLK